MSDGCVPHADSRIKQQRAPSFARMAMPFAIALLVLVALPACSRSADSAQATPAGDDAVTLPPAPPVSWTSNPGAQRIKDDVDALADDRMQGRATGTAGYALASDYVAKRFGAIGLKPAGDNGTFFQAVPLLQATRVEAGARFAVNRNGRTINLRFRDQYLPAPAFDTPTTDVEAAAVFVGQGVDAPALKRDDYAGLSVRGKIAVVFGGAPAAFDNDRRAYYSSRGEKLRAAAAHGAVGVVFVNTVDDEAGLPWARTAGNWEAPAMRLRNTDGKPIDSDAQLRVVATVSAAAADLVFADGPRTASELFGDARSGTLKGFALPGTLSLASSTRIDAIESRNVVASLPGRDPLLADQRVVYSAHLDHLGVGAPVKGDAIYNGAIDNALGVAIMLEAARTLARQSESPRRTMLFVAVAAEEQGLLGAEWFATHPPAPPASFVANINLDMPVLMAPSTDVIPVGTEHSTLRAAVDAAATDTGVTLSPDPFPEENVFVRSDQYAFIRAGIPALYLMGGVVPADRNKARKPDIAMRFFLRNCYHQPCDDSAQPIQYGDAERLARLNAKIGEHIGNDDAKPAWNAGDFFGTMFGAGAAQH